MSLVLGLSVLLRSISNNIGDAGGGGLCCCRCRSSSSWKWHFCCCYSIMRHCLFGSDASSEVPSFYGRPQRIRLYTHLRRVVPVLSMRDKG